MATESDSDGASLGVWPRGRSAARSGVGSLEGAGVSSSPAWPVPRAVEQGSSQAPSQPQTPSHPLTPDEVVLLGVTSKALLTESGREVLSQMQETLKEAVPRVEGGGMKELHLLHPVALPRDVDSAAVEAAAATLLLCCDKEGKPNRNAATLMLAVPFKLPLGHFAGDGYGMQAVRHISKGTVIAVYDGTLDSIREVQKREEEEVSPQAYVLTLGGGEEKLGRALAALCWNAGPTEGGSQPFLGGLINSPKKGSASPDGNVAFYEALGSGRCGGQILGTELRLQSWTVPYIFVVATEEIPPDEELLVAYGKHDDADTNYDEQIAINRGTSTAKAPVPKPQPSLQASGPVGNPDCSLHCSKMGSCISPALCPNCSPDKRKPPTVRLPPPPPRAKKAKLGGSNVARGLELPPSPTLLLRHLLSTEHEPHLLLALHAVLLDGIALPAAVAAELAVAEASAALEETEKISAVLAAGGSSLAAWSKFQADVADKAPEQQACKEAALAELAALRALTPPRLPPLFAAVAAKEWAQAPAPLAMLGQLSAFPAQAWLVAYRAEALEAVLRRGCHSLALNARAAAAEAAQHSHQRLAAETANVELLVGSVQGTTYARHLDAVKLELAILEKEMAAAEMNETAMVAAMVSEAACFEGQVTSVLRAAQNT